MGSILALGMAPAICKAENLMRIVVPSQTLCLGERGHLEGFRFITSPTMEDEMFRQIAERHSLVRDMLAYGALYATTDVSKVTYAMYGGPR